MYIRFACGQTVHITLGKGPLAPLHPRPGRAQPSRTHRAQEARGDDRNIGCTREEAGEDNTPAHARQGRANQAYSGALQ
jgi:hypothetical protein